MIIVKCDRCGKEETIENSSFPFNIFSKVEENLTSHYLIMNGAKQINLCADCEEAFDNFLGLNEVKDIEKEERNCENCYYFIEPHNCMAQKGMPRVESSEAKTCEFFITPEQCSMC